LATPRQALGEGIDLIVMAPGKREQFSGPARSGKRTGTCYKPDTDKRARVIALSRGAPKSPFNACAQHCESPLITPMQYSISHYYYYSEKMITRRLPITGAAISVTNANRNGPYGRVGH